MQLVVGFFAAALGIVGAIAPALSADAFPKFDVERNCKLETAVPTGVGVTLQSCISDELRAREDLQADWGKYKKADQASCVRETSIDGTPSYVELQVCLEMVGGR